MQALRVRCNDPTDATKIEGVIAGPDLKPLYDFALDCKTCEAKLATSK